MTIRERFAPLWAATKHAVARRPDARLAKVAPTLGQPTGLNITDQPNLPQGSTKRLIDPIVGEWVQLLPKIPPDQMRAWLLAGSQGSFYAAYSVYSIMEDQWPRLRKNLHELREAASRCKYAV